MYTSKIKYLLITLILMAACMSSTTSWKFFNAEDDRIQLIGRFDQEQRVSFSGSTIAFAFEGTGAKIHLKHQHHQFPINYYQVVIDGEEQVLEVTKDQEVYLLADSLEYKVHHVQVVRRTEAMIGIDQFLGVSVKDGALVPAKVPEKTIVFYGNSITCGYGNELSTMDPSNDHFTAQNENHYYTYAAIAARKLKAKHHSISYSGIGIYRNFDRDTVNTMHWCYDKYHPIAGEEGQWDFKEKPDLVVINLGTNDFYGEVPPQDKFVEAYLSFIHKLRKKYGEVPILCCLGPMLSDGYPPGQNAWSNAQEYLKEIQEKAAGNVRLLFFEPQKPPFGEDYHPTIATHQMMADTLSSFVQVVYKW